MMSPKRRFDCRCCRHVHRRLAVAAHWGKWDKRLLLYLVPVPLIGGITLGQR
ncbi:MAG: hypothetical protein R2856_11370 [Caldilineaceae bacterium]